MHRNTVSLEELAADSRAVNDRVPFDIECRETRVGDEVLDHRDGQDGSLKTVDINVQRVEHRGHEKTFRTTTLGGEALTVNQLAVYQCESTGEKFVIGDVRPPATCPVCGAEGDT